MASYPSSIYSPRTKANRAGVVYDAMKTTVGYAEDVTKLDDEVVAIENELGLNPKGTSASVLERIKGFRSLSGATADSLVISGVLVGIGTASPTTRLYIKDTSDCIFTIDGATGKSAQIRFNINGSSGYEWRFYTNTAGAPLSWERWTGSGWAQQVILSRTAGGGLGVGITPTAKIHMAAGTATASTGPLKFTSGVNLTTPETGAMEYDGTNLFFTRTGTTRESVFVGVSGATAPGTTPGVGIVNYYGASSSNFLGTPNSWASVVIAGTTYKIPLYT